MAQSGHVVEALNLRSAEVHRIELAEEEHLKEFDRFRGEFRNPSDGGKEQHRNRRRGWIEFGERAEAGEDAQMAPCPAQPPGERRIFRAVVAQIAAEQTAEFGADERVAPSAAEFPLQFRPRLLHECGEVGGELRVRILNRPEHLFPVVEIEDSGGGVEPQFEWQLPVAEQLPESGVNQPHLRQRRRIGAGVDAVVDAAPESELPGKTEDLVGSFAEPCPAGEPDRGADEAEFRRESAIRPGLDVEREDAAAQRLGRHSMPFVNGAEAAVGKDAPPVAPFAHDEFSGAVGRGSETLLELLRRARHGEAHDRFRLLPRGLHFEEGAAAGFTVETVGGLLRIESDGTAGHGQGLTFHSPWTF